MIEKTITYTNLLTKAEVTQTLYFHIYEEQLIEWMLTEGEEELPTHLREVVQKEDWPNLIRLFKKFINMGYGERVGDDFFQDPDRTKKFTGTAAYNALFMQLMQDEMAAAEFFNGLFPAELMARAQAAVEAQGGPGATLQNTELDLAQLKMTGPAGPIPGVGTGIPQKAMLPSRVVELSGLERPFASDNVTPLPWAFREPSPGDLNNMTKAQMSAVMKRKMSGWEPPEDL